MRVDEIGDATPREYPGAARRRVVDYASAPSALKTSAIERDEGTSCLRRDSELAARGAARSELGRVDGSTSVPKTP